MCVNVPDLFGVLGTVVALDLAAGWCTVKLATGKSLKLRPASLSVPKRDMSSLQPGQVGLWVNDKGVPVAVDPATALEFVGAAHNGDIESLRWGLAHGMHIDTTDDTGGGVRVTGLMLAAVQDQHEALMFLIEQGADLNLRFEAGPALSAARPGMSLATALAMAASEGNVRGVAALVEASADMNLPTAGDFTPLMIAVEKGHVKVVELLVKAGASQSATDFCGNTALMKAANKGNPRAVAALQDPAVLDMVQSQGFTALSQAANGCHLECVSLLLRRGASVNIVSREGNSALMMAAQSEAARGHADVITMLVQAGAALDVQTRDGVTALHVAVQHGAIAVVALLLRLGATVDVTDCKGHTAYDWAQEAHRHEAIQLIQQHISHDTKSGTMEIGSLALIHGLESTKGRDLNGMHGIVTSYIVDSGRYAITVDGATVNVKPANLKSMDVD
jgi:ankyrin repeat protein